MNTRNSSLIIRQTVSSATANSLRERILRGEFEEGRPLIQDVLAAEYGVSRIPLREALCQLETEGLVTSIPHRGYMVTVLSLEEAVEISEIRVLLECDVLAYAVPNMTKDHINKAQRVLDECDMILASDRNELKLSALNLEFHSILYEPSNRKRSLKLISSLRHSPDQLVRMKASAAVGLDKVYRKHTEILKFCRQGKVDEAVESMRGHILAVVDVMKEIHK